MTPIQNYLGAVLASGEQWQSWIHSDDLVAMFVYVLESKQEGVYNAVAPNPVRQSELTKTIGQNVHKKANFFTQCSRVHAKIDAWRYECGCA